MNSNKFRYNCDCPCNVHKLYLGKSWGSCSECGYYSCGECRHVNTIWGLNCSDCLEAKKSIFGDDNSDVELTGYSSDCQCDSEGKGLESDWNNCSDCGVYSCGEYGHLNTIQGLNCELCLHMKNLYFGIDDFEYGGYDYKCEGCGDETDITTSVKTNQGTYCTTCLNRTTLIYPPPLKPGQYCGCELCQKYLFSIDTGKEVWYKINYSIYCEECYRQILQKLEKPIHSVVRELRNSQRNKVYIEYVLILKNLCKNLFGTHLPIEIVTLIVQILYEPTQAVAYDYDSHCEECRYEIDVPNRVKTNKGTYCTTCLNISTLIYPPHIEPGQYHICDLCSKILYSPDTGKMVWYKMNCLIYCKDCHRQIFKKLQDQI